MSKSVVVEQNGFVSWARHMGVRNVFEVVARL